ncbi:fluoride efflux transporter CrcB [Oscillibacter sp.]|uniref:fluoride efflux transporter CrcB n=1 Tax=Oscillibacter sp. TaxID=1945593 RepID=UPI003396E8A0
MDLALVGVGGVFGGICRFQLGKVLSQKSNTLFPIGTFLINISGALLLGILTGVDMGNSGYLLFGDGFCGAFTTFSTFMYEGFHLFQERDKLNAFIYILSTLLLGIIGYVCGYAIGRTIARL